MPTGSSRRRPPASGRASLAEAREGQAYKFAVLGADGVTRLKADPFAFSAEPPPKTASVLYRSTHAWRDDDWLARREATDPLTAPVSIYEVHAGSWRQGLGLARAGRRAHEVRRRARVHPCRADARHAASVRAVVGLSGERLLRATRAARRAGRSARPRRRAARERGRRAARLGAGALPARRVGALPLRRHGAYEHVDPRRGAHPDWGTLVFNFGRHEVRNFLLANALYWLEEFHADGLRVDAVLDALSRLLARGGGVATEPLRRARRPRGGLVSEGAERRRRMPHIRALR